MYSYFLYLTFLLLISHFLSGAAKRRRCNLTSYILTSYLIINLSFFFLIFSDFWGGVSRPCLHFFVKSTAPACDISTFSKSSTFQVSNYFPFLATEHNPPPLAHNLTILIRKFPYRSLPVYKCAPKTPKIKQKPRITTKKYSNKHLSHLNTIKCKKGFFAT